ncbi:MAG: carboxypeptidase regulatory-like domain-containing protein [Salinibacter sp.]
MTIRTLFLATVFALLLPSLTHAQSNRGTVTGTVTDAEGKPLPGVQVVDPALQRGTTTDAQGRYRIDNLPIGDHTL